MRQVARVVAGVAMAARVDVDAGAVVVAAVVVGAGEALSTNPSRH